MGPSWVGSVGASNLGGVEFISGVGSVNTGSGCGGARVQVN